MKVAVNLLFCVPGVVGGSEDYTTALLRSYAEHGPNDIPLTLFALDSFARAHPDLAAAFETRTINVSGRIKPGRVALENSWLASQARNADIWHNFSHIVPARSTGAQVITVHDLQPLERPDQFGQVKRRYVGWALPRSIRRADVVATVSEHVRDAVFDRFGPAVDVVALPSGLGPGRPIAGAVPAALQRRLGDRRYLVYPAITHPHKNHATVLRALAEVEDVDLVLTGGAGPADDDVNSLIGSLDLVDRVHRVGRVDREFVDTTIAGAVALVFPSEFEGFGLPVLEAFASSTPVIASDIAPIRRVVGDAAELLDPHDHVAWAAAIRRMLAEPERRSRLVGRGLKVAETYNPEAASARLEALYRRLLG